eukprot:1160293-Pelagomonas_calceolata.AAC.1
MNGALWDAPICLHGAFCPFVRNIPKKRGAHLARPAALPAASCRKAECVHTSRVAPSCVSARKAHTPGCTDHMFQVKCNMPPSSILPCMGQLCCKGMHPA